MYYEMVLNWEEVTSIPPALMEKLLNVVDKDYCFRQDENGDTPLHVATENMETCRS